MKENFLKLLNLSRTKIRMLFTGLGRSVLGETVPSGDTQDLGQQFLPIRTSQPVNNLCIFYNTRLGLYPYFDSSGKAFNGGVPQVVELLLLCFFWWGCGGGPVGECNHMIRQPCRSTKQYRSFADLNFKKMS